MGVIRPKVITSAAAGAIQIAAAPGVGKHCVLHGAIIGLATAGTLKFCGDESGTPAELTGAIPLAAGVPFNAPKFPAPLPAASNKSLGFISAAGVTAGVAWYSIEDD